MPVAKVFGGQPEVNGGTIIEIETDLGRGLFSFSIVGLPDKAVEEAKDRVNSAIKNSGFKAPKSKNHKIVISLAPAHIKKEGPAFDLPIALSYLISSNDIKADLDKKIFMGELSLDGKIRPVRGVLPVAIESYKKGFKEIFVPEENAKEASLVSGLKIYKCKNLKDVVNHIKKLKEGEKRKLLEEERPFDFSKIKKDENMIDIGTIHGQQMAKRALEIAASGGHNLLLYGPPGTGKTMLAKAFTSILPELTFEEALEVTSIHSVSGSLKEDVIINPPFRAPHHTASYVSIIGGGVNIKPGEATLAHNGVLFLDEFPEFDRRVIESLREPLEEGSITVARSKGTAKFPSKFTLIAAMNPCPCGNYGSKKSCTCTPISILKYQRKISGPILDRIDMWVEVAEVEHKMLSKKTEGKSSKEIKERVKKAIKIQKERAEKLNLKINKNAQIEAKDIIEATIPSKEALETLEMAGKKLALSPRSFHRMLRLARTIADLEESEDIKQKHMLEALQFRQKREII